jgi:hypothetical protein
MGRWKKGRDGERKRKREETQRQREAEAVGLSRRTARESPGVFQALFSPPVAVPLPHTILWSLSSFTIHYNYSILFPNFLSICFSFIIIIITPFFFPFFHFHPVCKATVARVCNVM